MTYYFFARIEKKASEIWCMLSMRGRVEGGGEGVMHLECLAPQYTYSESRLFATVDLFHLY